MPPAKITKEMRPNGVLRPLILNWLTTPARISSSTRTAPRRTSRCGIVEPRCLMPSRTPAILVHWPSLGPSAFHTLAVLIVVDIRCCISSTFARFCDRVHNRRRVSPSLAGCTVMAIIAPVSMSVGRCVPDASGRPRDARVGIVRVLPLVVEALLRPTLASGSRVDVSMLLSCACRVREWLHSSPVSRRTIERSAAFASS